MSRPGYEIAPIDLGQTSGSRVVMADPDGNEHNT
jgi:hypothetical protein